MMKEPIQELDGVTVLFWLKVDASITYTGQVTMIHDGVLINNPAAFAVGRNDDDPGDILVLYCDIKWNVLAAAGYDSIDKAKECIEVAFSGTLNKWQPHSTMPGVL